MIATTAVRLSQRHMRARHCAERTRADRWPGGMKPDTSVSSFILCFLFALFHTSYVRSCMHSTTLSGARLIQDLQTSGVGK